MADPAAPAGMPSLLAVTIRRSLVVGRVSLLIGSVMVGFFSAAFGLGGALFATTGVVVLPVFAVTGGIGGILVFTNDRTKGVLEYLVAYGLAPRQILFNVIVACLVQVSIVLAVGSVAGISTYLLSGYTLTSQLPLALATYAFPMSYLTVSLMAILGVFWTSFSSPRSGMNSPLGILPMIGAIPTTMGLILALALPAYAVPILFGIQVAVGVAVLSLLVRTNRLLPPERLLSPA